MNLNIINNNEDFFTPDKIHYFNIQHKEIIIKLQYFVKNNQIPNIIFYGNNSCGKKYILKYFLQEIYKNNINIQDNILYINCCHGKGNIKFIREELKLFSNSIIINKLSNNNIKSVILLNADYLTIDAQSSLRRLIEVNNKNTRFFIVVNNYEKLLKPILSRFCSIYFNNPIVNKKFTTYNNILYNTSNNILYNTSNNNNNTNNNTNNDTNNNSNNNTNNNSNNNTNNNSNNNKIKKNIENIYTLNNIDLNNIDEYSNIKLIYISEELYNKGINSIDLLKYIDSVKSYDNLSKYKIITIFEYLVKEFRNEKIIMYFLLNYIYFRYNYNIKKLL